MRKLTVSFLLINLMGLSSCTNTLVDSMCPSPTYPSKATVDYVAKDDAPDSGWRDLVKWVSSSLKLEQANK